MIRLLVIILLLLAVGADAHPRHGGTSNFPAPPVTTGEEFVGPFPSWSCVKTLASGTCGAAAAAFCTATGNGTTDDTTALQTCFNSFTANSATRPVLWFPAGTYKVSDFTTTATASSGTYTLTVASGTNIQVGMLVSGAGIDPSNLVVAVSGTSVTLRTPVTQALSNTSVSFSLAIGGYGFVRTTATAGSGTNVLTVASASGLSVGQQIAGNNIPYDPCKISNIAGTSITIVKQDNTACNTTGSFSAMQVGFYNTGQTYISLIGEDPSTTTLKWAGSTGGVMLSLQGLAYSRLNRMTLNGNGTAGVILVDDWPNAGCCFNTGLEFADDVFENGGVALECGNTAGCADTVLMRDSILNNTVAGVQLLNYNALDVWVWYSLFQNNPRGITNVVSQGSAGQFHVFYSIFQNSTIADASTANQFGTTNLRGNYSTGSRRFWQGGGSSSVDPVSIQGNTILDTTDPHSIYQFDAGPILLLDNVIRSSGGTPVVEVPPDNPPAPAGIFSMGNTFTIGTGTCPTGGTSAPVYSTGPCHEIDDQIVSPSTVNPPAPTLPGTPPNRHRTIYEAATVSQIIGGITAAAATCDNSVVHIQPGLYNVSSTLTLPGNCAIQIIGDGGNSHLTWTGSGGGPMWLLTGPSKVTMRDFLAHGDGVAVGVRVAGADQAQASIFMEQVITSQGAPDLFVDALDYTTVEMHDSEFVSGLVGSESINVVGGASAASGTWLGGATNVFAALSWAFNGGLVHKSSAGAHFLLRDLWNEASTATVGDFTGGGTVTIAGAMMGNSRAGYNATAASGSTVISLSSTSGIQPGWYANNTTGEIPDHDAVVSVNSGANTVTLTSPTVGTLSITPVYFYAPLSVTIHDFTGAFTFADNYSFSNANITGTSSAPNILAIQSGPDTWFNNTSTPAASVEVLNSTNNIDTNNYLSIPEQNCCNAPFLRNALAQLRTTTPTQPTGRASGVTDARFYRVFVDNFAPDIHLTH